MGEGNESQSVFILNRESAEITGVCDVDSFNSTELVASLDSSKIAVEGNELKIDGFDSEKKRLNITGTIGGVYYFKARTSKKGMFSRG